MQLLQDTFIIENLQVLNEGASTGPMKITGVFGRCNEKNNNGRIYPTNILESQLSKVQPLIAERRLCGELDHPQNDTVKLSNASHLITKLEMKGNELIGEAELLRTPAGLTAQALINGGVKIGISSRGMGTLSEDREGNKIVNEDFRLVTFDLVADPSTRGAFPGLSESTESRFLRETQSKLEKEANFLTILEARLTGRSLDEEIGLGGSDEEGGGGSAGSAGGMSSRQRRDTKAQLKLAQARKAAAQAEKRGFLGQLGHGAGAGLGGLVKHAGRGIGKGIGSAAQGTGEGLGSGLGGALHKTGGGLGDLVKGGLKRTGVESGKAVTTAKNLAVRGGKAMLQNRRAGIQSGRGGFFNRGIGRLKRGGTFLANMGSNRVNAGTEYRQIGRVLAESFGLLEGCVTKKRTHTKNKKK